MARLHTRFFGPQARRAGPAPRAVAALAALTLSGGVAALAAVPAWATAGTTHPVLYVSPSGVTANSGTSCATAKYATIQSAVSAAVSGDTVYVCAGTYNEQVSVGTSGILIKGAGSSSVIDPTSSAPATVQDSDTLAPIVPIVDVKPGTTGVVIVNLAIDGSGLTSGFSWPGCTDQFAGILYQASSGRVDGVTVSNVALPPSLFGCQDGNAIQIEAAPTGTQNVTTGSSTLSIGQNTITGYDKTGIACNDKNVKCDIWQNTITGTVTPNIAQNGIQIGFAAHGSISRNNVSDNNYTGPTNTTEPQADYAAGILLYGATGTTSVSWNHLADNQIGIEVVHSSASVVSNKVTETSGITGSIGLFAAPCDYYCSYFSYSGGNVTVKAESNTITFPGTAGSPVSGSYGLWAGDSAASGTGVVHVYFTGNGITGAENNVVLGPTAQGTVTT